MEEAAIIAERVVRRMSAGAALDAEQAGRLVRSVAHACEHVLIEAPGTAQSRHERLRRAILDAGRLQLDDRQYRALEQAIAVSGHRPLPNER